MKIITEQQTFIMIQIEQEQGKGRTALTLQRTGINKKVAC